MKRHFARWITASLVVTAAAASTARAEQRLTYAVKVEASRVGEQVLVSTTITETLADGKTTRTISRPQIIMLEGQRGEVVIGQPVADAGAAQRPVPPAPPPAPVPPAPVPPAPRGEAQPAPGAPGRAPAAAANHDIQSGTRVDVISIKGEDKVLVITAVVRDGATVWAEAVTSKTTVKPKDQAK